MKNTSNTISELELEIIANKQAQMFLINARMVELLLDNTEVAQDSRPVFKTSTYSHSVGTNYDRLGDHEDSSPEMRNPSIHRAY